MLITELIAQLEALKNEHGDVPVYNFYEVDRKGHGNWVKACVPKYLDNLENDYPEEKIGAGVVL